LLASIIAFALLFLFLIATLWLYVVKPIFLLLNYIVVLFISNLKIILGVTVIVIFLLIVLGYVLEKLGYDT